MDARNVKNPDDLWSKVTNIWGELKRRDNYWVTLRDSMVDRLRMAREIGGEWTKYQLCNVCGIVDEFTNKEIKKKYVFIKRFYLHLMSIFKKIYNI